MKIFISDLHLTDGTTCTNNVRKEDVLSFWNDIQHGKGRDYTTASELIILGDFFDVIRSLRWDKVYPWDKLSIISDIITDIVKHAIEVNRPVLDVLKNCARSGTKITYVIGNHDRLINLVPEARQLIRTALGEHPGSDAEFPKEYINTALSVYAAHGHEADVYNRTFQGKSAIGDAVVTLLINRFPEHPLLKSLKEYKLLHTNLREIDNLRPTTIAPLWIEHTIRNFSREVKERVKSTWRQLVKEFYEIEFVKQWFDEYNIWFNPIDKASQLQAAIEYFTEASVEKIYRRLIEIRNDFYRPRDDMLKQATKDAEFYRCNYILYGHTHESCLHLLEQSNNQKKFYINCGTWRRRIIMGTLRKSTVSFAPLKTLSYVVFYEQEEIKQGNKRFELWDGWIS